MATQVAKHDCFPTEPTKQQIMNPKIWTEIITDKTTGKKFVLHIEREVPTWRQALHNLGFPVKLIEKETVKLLPIQATNRGKLPTTDLPMITD